MVRLTPEIGKETFVEQMTPCGPIMAHAPTHVILMTHPVSIEGLDKCINPFTKETLGFAGALTHK